MFNAAENAVQTEVSGPNWAIQEAFYAASKVQAFQKKLNWVLIGGLASGLYTAARSPGDRISGFLSGAAVGITVAQTILWAMKGPEGEKNVI